MTDPRVYRSSLVHDLAPRREEWTPKTDEDIRHVIVFDPEPIAVYVFELRSPEEWEAHLAFRPMAWGRAADVSLKVIEWLRATTTCKKVIACVPEYNRLTHRLVRAIGMREVRIEPACIRKDGLFQSRTIFEVNL